MVSNILNQETENGSSQKFEEPANMVNVILNKNGYSLEDAPKEKNKESKHQSVVTSIFRILSVFILIIFITLLTLILFQDDIKNYIKYNGDPKLYFYEAIEKCKTTKSREDCCKLSNFEDCSVNNLINLIVSYGDFKDKKFKRQVPSPGNIFNDLGSNEQLYTDQQSPNWNFNQNPSQQQEIYGPPQFQEPPQHNIQFPSPQNDYRTTYNQRQNFEDQRYNFPNGNLQEFQNYDAIQTDQVNQNIPKTRKTINFNTPVLKVIAPKLDPFKDEYTVNNISKKNPKTESILSASKNNLTKSINSKNLNNGNLPSNFTKIFPNNSSEVINSDDKSKNDSNVNDERISQGTDFNIKKGDSFSSTGEEGQLNQVPCLMYPLPTDARAMIPYSFSPPPPYYVVNPDIYTYSPSNHPSSFPIYPSINAYGPPPHFNSYPPYNPPFYNNYLPPAHSQNSKNSPKVSTQSGQFFLCNPIPPPANGIVNIPGVEIRRNLGAMNLQELVETAPEESNNHTREALECPFGEWSCFDGSKCISRRHLCDNIINCVDGSDEMICSCKNRVSEVRVCDAFPDCPNGEDEQGCFGCTENELSCDDWSRFRRGTCVSISHRCDGIKHCEVTGKDEEDCAILTDQVRSNGDDSLTINKISNSVGFLLRNYRGKWYPTCSGSEEWSVEVCKTEAGPSLGLPQVQMVKTNSRYDGPFVQMLPNRQTVLSNNCLKDQVAFVQCPPLYCGLRITIKNPYRPTEIDTSAEEILNRFGQFREADENFSRNQSFDNILGDSRVVGGKACQPAAWPWVVSIYKNGLFHCGGVLINEDWVVTAAHCVDKYWFFYYEIQAGMLRRYSYSPMEQIKWASVIIPHERYDKKTLKNDIAVIKLSSPVRFNRYVRPICLPSELTAGRDYMLGPAPGSVCIAIGWGATKEHGSDPDHLREVEVPILTHCKRLNDIQGDEICAGLVEGGKDACQGDSGGPLMCRNANNPNQWYLAGVVSHGEGCARPNEPGVYTKVSKYTGWIAETIRIDTINQKIPLTNCPGYICKATGKCLPKKRRCDKMVDCLLGDDEFNCWKSDISSSFVVGSTLQQNKRNLIDDLLNFFSLDVEEVTNTTTTSATTTSRITTTTFNPLENATSSYKLQTNMTEIPETINTPIITEATTLITTTIQTSDVEPLINNNSSKPNIFRCARYLQNIPLNQRCDRMIDCEDGTDEENCSCVDYLKTSYPESICDGFTDCKDLSDEMDCKNCSSNQYFCRLSQMCITLLKRCDGEIDCHKGEDEWDCLALTDGKTLTLDSDLRPRQTMKGIITINRFGVWRPLCTNASDNAPSIATNVCNLLGFEEYTMFHQLFVQDKPLNVTIDSFKSNYPTILPSNDNRCNGLYIGCLNISSVRQVYQDNNASTGELYSLPWSAVIYVDGKFRCVGTIVTTTWIIASKLCIENVIPTINYVAALLGKGIKTQLDVEGPHEQTVEITKWIEVNGTDVILLNTILKINFNRYIKAIQLTARTTSLVENCIAIGLEKDETRFVFLQSLKKCRIGLRCFQMVKTSDAFKEFKTSGTITCLSRDGWYPAAIFSKFSNLSKLQFTSLTFLKPKIDDTIDSTVLDYVKYSNCPGFICNLGECINKNKFCNGIPDCRSGEDEDVNLCSIGNEYCHLMGDCSCKPWEIKCKNGQCISKSLFCDGHNDCGDYSDEPSTCSCRSYMELAHPEIVCDGVVNCYDRSDEDPRLCGCRLQAAFRCGQSNYCVSNEMICDNFKDCPDGEDENLCHSLRTNHNRYNNGEVMVQTAGIWHSACFTRNLTTTALEEICQQLGFNGGSARQLTPPKNADSISVKPIRDQFQTVWIRRTNGKKLRWWIRTGNQPYITLVPDSKCHKLFIECS